ncbi:MAG TPA: 3',5'-cyclic-nucleotide phosphodiesterase [Methylovorus sp.]|nr:3',5'-cyclic-nucleotide phosphodiesterase [Methylovorus sp.]
MQVKVLGCSGGIGGNLRTTSLLVDDDILIDAGTGVGDLSMEQMARIDHVFLTHSHLDHIACLPLMLDTVAGLRDTPVTIYGLPETLDALKTHIFNWIIWPDFSVVPSEASPLMRYAAIEPGETISLAERRITPLPANHTVPAVGYWLDSGANSMVFTGDTTTCDALWEQVNRIENLKYLLIETAFGNDELALAQASRHLCPSLLFEELAKLKIPAHVYITHLKPGEGSEIMYQIEQSSQHATLRGLQNMQVFKL